MVWIRKAPALAIAVVLLLGAILPAHTAAKQNSTPTPEDYAVYYSTLEAAGDFSTLYDYLHPDAQNITPEAAVVGWYTNEFAPRGPGVITVTAVHYVSWTWGVIGKTYDNTAEISFVQPFADGSWVEDVVRLVEYNGEWRWFFGRSREFVDQQIALYAPSSQQTTNRDTTNTTSRDNNSSNSDRSGSSQSGSNSTPRRSGPANTSCTVVELYPGYPGYRGNITGVMPHWNGQGDYECLETLEQQHPGFSRSREDRANQNAADALGIDGTMDVWTWENWMYIEVERGMVPSCYSCLMLDPSTTPIRTDIAPPTDDVRIATGLLGSTTTMASVASYLQFDRVALSRLNNRYDDDYQIRAIGYYSDPTMNAAQLLQSMVEYIKSVGGPPSYPLDYRKILNRAIWQDGGYIPVPGAASSGDQIFLMSVSIDLAATSCCSGTQSEQWIWILFQDSIDHWYQSGMQEPLFRSMQRDGNWLDYQNYSN